MPHLHNEPGQHDVTVSAFIIRQENGEPELLLHQHKKLGIWLQPGGHVELKENPWQALQHEVLEETGYELHQLKLLQPEPVGLLLEKSILHPVPAVSSTHGFDAWPDHYHTDSAYFFTTDASPSGPIGDNESNLLTWFDEKSLKAIPQDDIVEDVRRIGLYAMKMASNPNWVTQDTSIFSLTW